MTEPFPTCDEKDAWLDAALRRHLSLTNEMCQPNLSSLAMRLKDIDILALNIKYFGFELARRFASELPPMENLAYRRVGLTCKASTQDDLESEWCAYWCSQLKIPVVFHRKLWEFCFLLQALAEHGQLEPGRRGLGFGCGEEPIASYLASRGVRATISDLRDEDAAASGWRQTGQHLTSLEFAYKPYLASREAFDKFVSHRFVDMNAIPKDLVDYDFCWSICSLEHLGSIDKGMDFVINALGTLKPGGVGVHTTEFNFLDNERTLDNWPTVLPQRRHFEQLAECLRAEGHEVLPLDFDVGNKPLDRFIDVPPYPGDAAGTLETMRAHDDSNHLKLSIDGFASTCFGLIIRKTLP